MIVSAPLRQHHRADNLRGLARRFDPVWRGGENAGDDPLELSGVGSEHDLPAGNRAERCGVLRQYGQRICIEHDPAPPRATKAIDVLQHRSLTPAAGPITTALDLAVNCNQLGGVSEDDVITAATEEAATISAAGGGQQRHRPCPDP